MLCFCVLCLRSLTPAVLSPNLTRSFTGSILWRAKQLPPRLKLDDADLTISYLKGSGPGGQKINKTNSAVQISHKPTGIVVKSQATRSRSQNEKIARQLLADKVEQLQKGDQSRAALKAEEARKKKSSRMKKNRRKYRGLENSKEPPNTVDDQTQEADQEEQGQDREIEVKST